MKFTGEKVKELREQRKKLENRNRSKQNNGTYQPYLEEIDRAIDQNFDLVQEIRDQYFDTIRDAPVNLKYLMADSNSIVDWRKLKSTKYKMDILDLDERDIKNFMNSVSKP